MIWELHSVAKLQILIMVLQIKDLGKAPFTIPSYGISLIFSSGVIIHGVTFNILLFRTRPIDLNLRNATILVIDVHPRFYINGMRLLETWS